MTTRVDAAGTSIETFIETVHDQVVRTIVDVVNELFPDVTISTDDILALDATSEMKDKLSQHYISRPLTYELVWSNNNALKQVTEKVNERLLDIQLDDKVYTPNRLFRILGACKRGDEHIPGRRLRNYGLQDRPEIDYFVTYLRANVSHVNVPSEEPRNNTKSVRCAPARRCQHPNLTLSTNVRSNVYDKKFLNSVINKAIISMHIKKQAKTSFAFKWLQKITSSRLNVNT